MPEYNNNNNKKYFRFVAQSCRLQCYVYMRNLLSPYCLESASQFFPRCVFFLAVFSSTFSESCVDVHVIERERVENISALGDSCLFCCLIPIFPMLFRFSGAKCSFGGGVSGRIIRMVDRKKKHTHTPYRIRSFFSQKKSDGKMLYSFEIETLPP